MSGQLAIVINTDELVAAFRDFLDRTDFEINMPVSNGMTSTTVQVYSELFGWQTVSLIHRTDLSDLGEPYLSLVREKRDACLEASGLAGGGAAADGGHPVDV